MSNRQDLNTIKDGLPSAPEWATWIAIDFDGTITAFDEEPKPAAKRNMWARKGHRETLGKRGITSAWRNCKWPVNTTCP